MPARTISIDAKDQSGRFKAYVAYPESGSGSVVVAIQEIFGVNTPMRLICDKLAEDGYIAICPDLFWRQEPDIQLNDKLSKDWDRAFELYKGFDLDNGIEDIAATIATARKIEGSSGKVAVIGYCLGGMLAYLSACRTNADAAIGYYGVGIDGKLDEAAHIKGQLMLHIAREDGFVDKQAQAAIHQALDGHDHVIVHDYADVDHAFARPGGTHYDQAAAEKANARTAAFLKENIG
ncbi:MULTISPECIES: dienelactone hydrolase family protein [unclassified Iodidimonas]|jgi:carboxymethylenebutenolidase|uniref:dienelactone hydrolase family protein n=1 Tax=unclassified Iodidimonas TaxID=2626145 RepID=UPI0024824A77|nr:MULTISPECIES: dienelactone hydrolase family protein [unclassified Iodidimonas]